MTQIMFETFNSPAMYVAIQAVLSLYASGPISNGITVAAEEEEEEEGGCIPQEVVVEEEEVVDGSTAHGEEQHELLVLSEEGAVIVKAEELDTEQQLTLVEVSSSS